MAITATLGFLHDASFDLKTLQQEIDGFDNDLALRFYVLDELSQICNLDGSYTPSRPGLLLRRLA